MGFFERLVYRVFPSIPTYEKKIEATLKSFETKADGVISDFSKKTDKILDDFQRAYTLVSGVSDYVSANKNMIIDDVFAFAKRQLNNYVDSTKVNAEPTTQSAKPFTVSPTLGGDMVFGKSNAPDKRTFASDKPISPIPVQTPKPIADYSGIESMIDRFGEQMSSYNPKFRIRVDFYEQDGSARSYSVDGQDNVSTRQNMNLESKVSQTALKRNEYDSVRNHSIIDLYNQGLGSKEIVRLAKKQGDGILSYADVICQVCNELTSGATYGRRKYNSSIASHMGIETQLLDAYASGKSYAEIKDLLGSKIKGMGVSESTLRRLARRNGIKRASRIA